VDIHSRSQAAFGTTFRVAGCYRKAGKRIQQLVSDFVEASRKFILDFLHKMTPKNFENHQHTFEKYYFDF